MKQFSLSDLFCFDQASLDGSHHTGLVPIDVNGKCVQATAKEMAGYFECHLPQTVIADAPKLVLFDSTSTAVLFV